MSYEDLTTSFKVIVTRHFDIEVFCDWIFSKCKQVEKSGKELNKGQHIFEWKFFTQKGVSQWIIHSKKSWYCDHKICDHSFQSGLPLEIVLSCV